ncbi:MAG: tetratricopeptide repeat protein [Planctomycetota bacterium]
MNSNLLRPMLLLFVIAAPLAAQPGQKLITDDDVESDLITLQEQLVKVQRGSMKPAELKRHYQREAAQAPTGRDKAIAYYVLGQGLAMTGNAPEARESMEQAISHYKGILPAYISLSKLAVLSGSLDDARRYAERALELEPDYGQAFLMLGTVSRFKSDWDQALEYYRLAQKKDVSDDSCNQLTSACMQRWQTTYTKRFKKDYAEEALRAAKTWRALSPRSPLPYLKLESVYTMLGRTDDARKLLKKGLAAEMSPRAKVKLAERWVLIELSGRHVESSKAALRELSKYSNQMPAAKREHIASMLKDLEEKGPIAFVVWQADDALRVLKNKGRSQEDRRIALIDLIRLWARIEQAYEPRLAELYREIRSTIVRTCVTGPAVLQLDMLRFFKHEMPDARLIGVMVHFMYPWQRTVKVRTEAMRTIRSVMGIAGIPTLLFALDDDDGTVLRTIDRGLSDLTSRRSRVGEESTPLTPEQIKIVRQDWYRWRNTEAGSTALVGSIKELRKFVRLDGDAKGAPLAHHVGRLVVSRDVQFPAWKEAYRFLRDYLGETFLEKKDREAEVGPEHRERITKRVEEFQRAAQGAGLEEETAGANQGDGAGGSGK